MSTSSGATMAFFPSIERVEYLQFGLDLRMHVPLGRSAPTPIGRYITAETRPSTLITREGARGRHRGWFHGQRRACGVERSAGPCKAKSDVEEHSEIPSSRRGPMGEDDEGVVNVILVLVER